MKHEKVAKIRYFTRNDNQILNLNAMFVVKAQRGQSEIATDVLKMTISHLTQDHDLT